MSLTAFGFLTSSDSSIPRTGSCNRFLKSSPCVLIVFNVLFKGLSGSNTGLGHALVPVVGEEEKLDTGNFRKETNSASFVFFNGADISICLMLWVASALLLIGIYLRFVSGKRFPHSWQNKFTFAAFILYSSESITWKPSLSLFNARFFHSSLISQLRRRTGFSSPLLPKWHRPPVINRPSLAEEGRGKLRVQLIAKYFPAGNSS